MCISLEPLSSFDFEQSDRLDEPTINASMVPYAVIELSPTPHIENMVVIGLTGARYAVTLSEQEGAQIHMPRK